MQGLLSDLPLEAVLAGNAFASAVAWLFVATAPVEPDRHALRWWVSAFWLLLVIYYVARLLAGAVVPQPRLSQFVGFLRYNDFVWLPLVVLSDLPTAALAWGFGAHAFWTRRKTYVAVGIGAACLAAWSAAVVLHHTAVSATLTFVMLFYVSWRQRTTSIANAMLWLSYAVLHLPLRLAFSAPTEWATSLFLLLVVAKFSLVPPMYAALGVRSREGSGSTVDGKGAGHGPE